MAPSKWRGPNSSVSTSSSDGASSARNDPREVVADPNARYFGAELSERTLVPDDDAQLGEIRFEDWLSQPGATRGSGRSQRSGSEGM